jgi:hypothetical protein
VFLPFIRPHWLASHLCPRANLINLLGAYLGA